MTGSPAGEMTRPPILIMGGERKEPIKYSGSSENGKSTWDGAYREGSLEEVVLWAWKDAQGSDGATPLWKVWGEAAHILPLAAP